MQRVHCLEPPLTEQRSVSETRGVHDVGGLPGGPIDQDEHDTAYWEWQIDAMVRLALQKGLISDFAELRHGIEQLSRRDYEQCSYYERWARSLAWTLLANGTVTEAELQRKISEIRSRRQHQGAV